MRPTNEHTSTNQLLSSLLQRLTNNNCVFIDYCNSNKQMKFWHSLNATKARTLITENFKCKFVTKRLLQGSYRTSPVAFQDLFVVFSMTFQDFLGPRHDFRTFQAVTSKTFQDRYEPCIIWQKLLMLNKDLVKLHNIKTETKPTTITNLFNGP